MVVDTNSGTHPTDDYPELPTLDPGVVLLDAEDRATGAVHSLVLDRLLATDGGAYWVDARGNATSRPLARLAPSDRLLDRIAVARAFTAFQHYSLVDSLAGHVDPGAALVVLPAVDSFYATDDLLRGEGEEMLSGAMKRVRAVADGHDLPVLLTRHGAGGIGGAVADAADERLRCELTARGPRFASSTFDTLVYPERGFVQTTLAYWHRVLERRAAAHRQPAPERPEGEGTADRTTEQPGVVARG